MVIIGISLVVGGRVLGFGLGFIKLKVVKIWYIKGKELNILKVCFFFVCVSWKIIFVFIY